MFGKYSVNNLICEFVQNKDKIHAFATGKCVESYNGNNEDDNKILGLSIGLFLFIFTIALAIWIWALVALLQNWSRLSDLVKIIAVLALMGILGGPVVTLIIVYVMRNGNGKRSSVEVPMKNLKYKMNKEKQSSSPSPTSKQASIHWAPARQDGESDIYWYDVNNPKNVTWNNPMPGIDLPENTIAVAYPPDDPRYHRNEGFARYMMLKKYPEMALGPGGGGGGGPPLGKWHINYPPPPPPRLSPDVIPTTQEIGPDGTEVPEFNESYGDISEHHKPIPYDAKKDMSLRNPDSECSLSGGKGCTIS